ncbi:MAG: cytochrome c3 family protein [Polyangiaceae bacterium]
MRALLVVVLMLASAVAACSSNDAAIVSDTAQQDSQACAGCHLADFQGVRRPPHVGEKPTTCAVCHTQKSWHPSVLNHAWPLTGAHAKASSCFECHKGDPALFQGTPKTCIGCHAADYQRGPNHVAEHFPTTCETCHSTTAFKPLLEGAHAPATKSPAPVEDASAKSATSAAPKKTPPKPKSPTAPTATWSAAPDATSGASTRRGR